MLHIFTIFDNIITHPIKPGKRTHLHIHAHSSPTWHMIIISPAYDYPHTQQSITLMYRTQERTDDDVTWDEFTSHNTPTTNVSIKFGTQHVQLPPKSFTFLISTTFLTFWSQLHSVNNTTRPVGGHSWLKHKYPFNFLWSDKDAKYSPLIRTRRMFFFAEHRNIVLRH